MAGRHARKGKPAPEGETLSVMVNLRLSPSQLADLEAMLRPRQSLQEFVRALIDAARDKHKAKTK